jgi:asparagine synthase
VTGFQGKGNETEVLPSVVGIVVDLSRSGADARPNILYPEISQCKSLELLSGTIWIQSANGVVEIRNDPFSNQEVYLHRIGGRIYLTDALPRSAGNLRVNTDTLSLARLAVGVRTKPEITPFAEVKRLPAGWVACFAKGVEPVWRRSSLTIQPTEVAGFEHATDDLTAVLQRSLARQLADKSKIGVELSGGIDSGTVASLAYELIAPKELSLFHASSSSEAWEDTESAKRIARHLNAELQVFDVDVYQRELLASDETGVTPRAILGYEDSFGAWCDNRLLPAPKSIIVTGFQADQIFWTEARRPIDLHPKSHLNTISHVLLGLGGGLKSEPRGLWKRFADVYRRCRVGPFPPLFGLLTRPRPWMSRDLLEQIIEEHLQQFAEQLEWTADEMIRAGFPRSSIPSHIAFTSAADVRPCWVDLYRSDKEIVRKSPFIDAEVISFVYSLPAHFKLACLFERFEQKLLLRASAPEWFPRLARLGQVGNCFTICGTKLAVRLAPKMERYFLSCENPLFESRVIHRQPLLDILREPRRVQQSAGLLLSMYATSRWLDHVSAQ